MKKRLTKIAINATPLLKTQTGIARYIRCLFTELDQSEKLSLSFFLGGKWKDHLPEIHSQGSTKKHWVQKLQWVRSIPGSYFLKSTLEGPLFKKGSTECDFIHEPNYVPITTSKPTVLTICDMSYIKYPETLPKNRLKWLKKGLPRAVKESKGIITISDFSKKEILTHFDIDEQNVYSIPLGVEDHYTPVDLSKQINTLKKYSLQPDDYILAVGSLEPRKNLKTLILAYSHFYKIQNEIPKLVIAGPSGWGNVDFPEYTDFLVKIGMIRFVGYIPEEDMPVLYSGATIFAMPSIYEGFGLPVLEAMACRCPVIVSNDSSLPEVCGEAGIIVDSKNVKTWTHSLKEIISAKEQRQKMQDLGEKRAELFSWKKCSLKTIEAYETFNLIRK